jgi:hypothetical protein
MKDSIDEGVGFVPPFRSSKEFPISPKSDKVQALYTECFHALGEANEARRILRKRMDSKRDMISDIRTEIERLELDLSIEADTRIQLHAMNEKLIDAMKEIQNTSEDFTRIVDEAQRVQRTGIGTMVEQLKGLVRRWRAFQFHQRETLAPGVEIGHDKESDG